jgi:hypothetical protein
VCKPTLRHGNEQSGVEAVPGNITDNQAHRVVVTDQIVVEIATHFRGLAAHAREFEAVGQQPLAGQHALLDFPGPVQVLTPALPLTLQTHGAFHVFPELSRQHLEDTAGNLRILIQGLLKIPPLPTQQRHRRIGDGGGAAGLLVDERDLTDTIAPLPVNERHAGGFQPQPALHHQVNRVALFALIEKNVTHRQGHFLQASVDTRYQGRGHCGQKLGGS